MFEDFKRGHSRGSIGLWGLANGGHFSNFSYRMEPADRREEKKIASIAGGIIFRWEISEAFESREKDPETLPSQSEIRKMKWEPVGVEPPGMVVIDRYRRSSGVVPVFSEPEMRTGERPGRKVSFARAIVNSDRDQIKKMSFGYSDEVTIFLNSKPIFTGKSAFRFRDPDFLE